MGPDPSHRLPDYLQISIGPVVRAWRMERGLTLEELAAQAGAGITRGYLSQLENDKIHSPGERKVAQIATALGVDPLVLVTRQMPSHGRDVDDTTAALPAQSIRVSEVENLSADVSRLLKVLADLPPDQQQRYTDALVALVERLTRVS